MIPFLDLKKIYELHQQEFDDAIYRVAHSGWYLMDEEVDKFENEYADFIGTKHAIGVGNGLDAITIIFKAFMEMGLLKPGDEVIVPANTFIASVIAVIRAGLKPVLADANPDTLLMDQNLLPNYLTDKTRAVMIVHLYGRCAYSDYINDFCKFNGLLLIEDNAQAHGCRFENKRTGALGDAAAHSFYPGKNLGALGDAGAITTDNDQLALTVKAISNYGFRKKYFADVLGVNSRLDEIQAAVLRVKLKYIDYENNIRKKKADLYYKRINNCLVKLPLIFENQDNVYHLFPIITDYREQLQKFLDKHGIQTVIHYPVPPHKQNALNMFNQISMPVTEFIAQKELSLPISQVITDEQINYVAEVVNNFNC